MIPFSYKDFFNEQLMDELFKDTYPYQMVRAIGSFRRTYGFETDDGTEYEVVIDKNETVDIPEDLIDVLKTFGYEDDENITYYVMGIVFGNLIGPRKVRNYNPHTVQNPTRILGTVIKIIDENVSDDEIIYFSSKEESRTKLYSHLVRRLKRPNDYIHQQKIDGETEFLLIPKKK
jgi:hypothetical protein